METQLEKYLRKVNCMEQVTTPVISSKWVRVNPTESIESVLGSVPPTNFSGDERDFTSFEVMNLFLDDFIEKIVEYSNRAFLERKEPSARDRYWKTIDSAELKKFIGIMIMMGIDRKPSFEMHWETHGMWSSPLITSTMSMNKFYVIGRYLSMGIADKNDKLARVREISNIVNEKSIQNYKPTKELSLDESMIAYKGKHGLKQYLPMKPTKWGFKAFLLCESTTGFCVRHKLFSGPGQEEFKTKNLCIDLCQGFEHQDASVYADNYYSSKEL